MYVYIDLIDFYIDLIDVHADKLDDYIEVEDISKVSLNTHIRYFTDKYDEKKKKKHKNTLFN